MAAAKKAASKTASPKKAAPKKPPATPAKPAPAKTPAEAASPTKPATKPPAKTPAEAASPKKPAAKRDPAKGPVVKTRVVIPMEVYEPQKDAIKAPFKAHELKWTFLGEGRGLYKRADNGVHCFTQFKDDGVHYSVWGDDTVRRDAILATWRALLGPEGWAKATATGEAAVQAEKQEAQSEALQLWKMQEPQPRPGEPEVFLRKRREEWLAKKPAG